MARAATCFAAQFTRQEEFSAVTLNQNELKGILQKAHSLVTSLSKGKEGKILERCRFASDESQMDIEGIDFTEALQNFPSPVTSFTYSFDLHEGPITSVSLNFGNLERKLSVSGTSVEDVDTIVAALREKISLYQSTIGGFMWSYSVRCIALLSGFAGVIGAIAGFRQPRQRRLSGVYALAALTGWLVLPVDKWLAGFLLFPQEKSWVTIYAPQLAVFGAISSALGLLAYLFPARPPASSK